MYRPNSLDTWSRGFPPYRLCDRMSLKLCNWLPRNGVTSMPTAKDMDLWVAGVTKRRYIRLCRTTASLSYAPTVISFLGDHPISYVFVDSSYVVGVKKWFNWMIALLSTTQTQQCRKIAGSRRSIQSPGFWSRSKQTGVCSCETCSLTYCSTPALQWVRWH